MGVVFRDALFWICWLAVFAVVTPESSLAENWPCFRGPTRQGISNEKGIPTQWSAMKNIAWKTPIPGEGWSSPIVFDDRVFVTTATDEGASFRLLCLDRLRGAVLWNKEVSSKSRDIS